MFRRMNFKGPRQFSPAFGLWAQSVVADLIGQESASPSAGHLGAAIVERSN